MSTQLGVGYIELGIRYDNTLKQINADIGGLEGAAATVAKNVTSNLSRGFEGASKAAQQEMRKVEDAIKNVAKLERELNDLRKGGAGAATIQVQSERIKQAKKAEADAVKATATAYESAALNAGAFSNALAGLATGAGLSSKAADKLASSITGISGKTALFATGIVGAGLVVVGLGKQLYDLGAQWDEISDRITVRTGKVGDSLKVLTDAVGDVGKVTAASLGSISDIMAQLSQSAPGLAQNNAALKQMASNLAYLDANGVSVDIRELGKAFSAFNIQAEDQVKTLDELNNVSQQTNIPLNELIGSVKDGAPQFRQFGLDVGEATGLLAAFESGGLNTGVAVTGLRNALKTLSDDARGSAPALADVVTQIKALHDAGQESLAQKLASDTFGTRNFAPFLQAIESGRVNVQGLNQALSQTGISIADLQKATDDGAQGFVKLRNIAQTALKPIADFLFSNVNQPLLQIADSIDSLEHKATAPISPDSPLGRLLIPGSLQPGGSPGVPGLPLPTTKPGQATTGLGPLTTSFYKDWYKTPEELKKQQQEELSNKPVLPVNTALPPGFANLPQNVDILGAESSFIDARHNLEEKQAELDQLEKSNLASANDIQDAKNKVYDAERNLQTDTLKLYDTRQAMFDKERKRAEDENKRIDEEAKKYESRFSGGSLLDFLIWLAFKPVHDAAAQQSAALNLGQSTKGGGPIDILPGSQGTTLADIGVPGVSQPGQVGAPAAAGAPGGAPRVPYGLPAGSDSGGYSGSGVQFPDWVNQLGAAFNIKPSTYPGHQETNRNEPGYAPNPEGLNRAIDWSGSPENLQRFADYLKTIPQDLEQVIWKNPTTGQEIGVGGGRDVSGSYFDQTGEGSYAEHTDHVHTRQSQSIPLPGGVTTAATPPGGSGGPGGNEQIVHQAMLSIWGEDQWPALRNLMMKESGFDNTATGKPVPGQGQAYGMFQFMPATWGTYGAKTDDPALQTQYGMQYIKDRYGSPAAAWGQYFNHPSGEGSYAAGGSIPGFGGGDKVPILAEGGEFVVNKNAARQWMPFLKGINAKGYDTGGTVGDGNFNPGMQVDLSHINVDDPAQFKYPPWMWAGIVGGGHPRADVPWMKTTGEFSPGEGPLGDIVRKSIRKSKGFQTGGSVDDDLLKRYSSGVQGPALALWDAGRAGAKGLWNQTGSVRSGDWSKMLFGEWAGTRIPGFQVGGPIDPNEILQQLAQQGQLPGAQHTPAQGQQPIGPDMMSATPGKDQSTPLNVGRTQGYIPAGAGASGQAGSSLFSGSVGLAADVINKLIDEGVSAASSAAGVAGSAFSFGAGGGAAAGATSAALGIGADIAKKGVSYGAQVIGILGDSLAEILLPFGVPRFFQTDPRGFMPQIAGLPAAVTTGEKALLGDKGKPEQQPGAPVQPGQLPGRQPVGAPVTKADPGGVASMPIDIGQILGGDQGKKFGPGIPGKDATTGGPRQQPGSLSGPGSPKPPKQPKPGPPGQPSTGQKPPATPKPQHGVPGSSGRVTPSNPDYLSMLGIYDSGGWLMPNQLAMNTTKRPEPILSDQELRSVKAIAGQTPGKYDPSSAGVSNDYSVRIDSVTVKDVEALSREVNDRQRLQMMRHNGRPLLGANS